MTCADCFVHESSYVEDGSTIGAGTHIWHFSHVMADASIGRDCTIGQNVFIGAGVVIGDHVKIQNNVSVYTGVVLEDEVFCGPSVVFTNVLNPRSEIARRDEYRSTRVRRGATIGANATIVCGADIGRYAFIGAGAVVRGRVPDYALMLGVPASPAGWMGRHGHKLVPADGSGRWSCPVTGWRYEQGPSGLRCLNQDEERPL
ncbi:MAG: N-acetyltransferase [Acidobacteria bacterium]|nr:N-acetyltransferase [Acidobacteriota bacterium]